jgi:hypothetical protein
VRELDTKHQEQLFQRALQFHDHVRELT